MKKIFLVIFMFVILISCGKKQADEKEYIVASMGPIAYIVENIAKDVDVVTVAPEIASHESFEIDIEDMKKIDNAKLYFIFDLFPFEETIEEYVGNDDKVINILENVDKNLYIKDTHHNDHGHHHEHEHSHGDFDPHVWFSIDIVKEASKEILDKLVEIYPDKKEEYTKNYNQFVVFLSDQKEKNDMELKALGHLHYIIYHPALGYVTKGSRVHEVALEHEGKEASIQDLKEIIDLAKEEHVKSIYVQPQFPSESVSVLKEALGNDTKVINLNLDAKDFIQTINTFIEGLK